MVKPSKEYRIPFLGLKLGKHQFQFTLKDEFFDSFEFSEIERAGINVDLELEKQSTMMILDFKISGFVIMPCDRCGDDVNQPVEAIQKLVVKYGEETIDNEDELLMLGPSEYEIDLYHYLYEYAHLALPIRHVHNQLSECNQQVISELEKYRIDTTANTQWAELKNLNYEDPEDDEFFDDEEE